MSTLEAINEQLMTQNAVLGLIGQEQTNTTRGIKRLNDFMEMEADRLREAEYENRDTDETPQTRPGRGSGSAGEGIAGMFDKMGFLKGLIGGAAIKALLGGLAVMLADEIGAGIKAITGSDLAAGLAEYGLVGAGLGSIFGVKGAVFGAIAGGLVFLSQKIGDGVKDYLKEQEFSTPELAGEIASAFSLAAGGAAMGAMVGGPFGAIAGAIGGLAAGGLITTYKYLTDPVFQENVDKEVDKIKIEINRISNALNSWLEENVRNPMVRFADNMAISFGMSTSADRTAENVQAIDEEIENVKEKLAGMTAEAQSLRRRAGDIQAYEYEKGAERDEAMQLKAELLAQADEISAARDKLSREEIGMSTGRLTLLRTATIEANQIARENKAAEVETNYDEQVKQQESIKTTPMLQAGLGSSTTGQSLAEAQEEAVNTASSVNVGKVGDDVTNNYSTATLAGETRPSTANHGTPPHFLTVSP